MTQAIDTFVRANQSGWGTASDGETWTKIAGASPTLAIASNMGTWTGVTGSATYALGTNTFTDVEVSVRLKITNAGDSVGIFARSDSGASNFYRAFAQNTTLTLSKTVAGTTTSLTTGAITFNTATLYWLKLRVIGNGGGFTNNVPNSVATLHVGGVVTLSGGGTVCCSMGPALAFRRPR